MNSDSADRRGSKAGDGDRNSQPAADESTIRVAVRWLIAMILAGVCVFIVVGYA